MKLSFVVVCMLGACIARADVYYDFETAATTPVWLGATQMIQKTSASHQGTNAIAFTGTYPDFYILTELPQGTTNVEFYFYDDYGPNPPLYQYMLFWLLEATNAEPFAGFTMNDGGWGTTPPRTKNHYYAWGKEEYSERTMGPVRTVGWHKFTFAVGAESVAMSVDDALVFQTNMIRTARYLKLSPAGGCAGWGRMDDLFISSGIWPPPPCVTPRSGLVGWWAGDGNANDSVGTNNGTLQNGGSCAPGLVGQAFSFDGIDDVVQVPSSPTLSFVPQAPMTVELWAYRTSTAGVMHVVGKRVGCGGDNAEINYQMAFNVPAGEGLTFGAGHSNMVASGLDMPMNTWTHLAGTFDGWDFRLYVNGGLVGIHAGTLGPQNTAPLLIGGSGDCAKFVGLIDEVSVYSRALTTSEIAAIYNAGISGKCGLPPLLALQPTNFFVLAGSNVVFAAAATGTQPLSYQWALNDIHLLGATNTALSLSNVSGLNAGFYTVIVSNSICSVTSTPALLDVRYALAYGNGALLPGINYTFIGSVALQLWSVFPNANIFYTLDGAEPSFASSYYGGPFNLNRTATLRVIAYSTDFLQAAESPPIYFTIIPTYALNLTSPGGTITASPPLGPYVSNTVVTLTPQPSNGWTFLEWRGDASGASPTVALTMNRAKSVQAVFGTTLSTTVAGNGAVDVYPALPLYPYGSVARLTAIPQAGNYFGTWGNAATGNTNPLYFTVASASPAVSSLFAALGADRHALTVIPDGFGRVTITPRANFYATGASVSLNAIPDPGQQFLAWSGDATGTQNPLTVSMNTSKTVTATFTRKPSLAVAPLFGGLFGDGFRLTLTGESGGRYEILGSTNLVDWLPAATVTNIYGTIQFTDSAATNLPARLYRAASAP